MPMPLSATLRLSVCPSETRLTRTLPPSAVYLKAFSTRFCTSRDMRPTSMFA